jgi:para-aminobenzoate synthetase component I
VSGVTLAPGSTPGTAHLRPLPTDAVPRTPAGLVDLDRAAAALGDVDVLETAVDRAGWCYLVPPGGGRLLDDGARTRLLAADGRALDLGTDPFAAVETWCGDHGVTPHAPRDTSLPPFSGGLVGAFAYDLVRRVERVPQVAAADRDQPHLSLRVAELVVAIAPGRRDAALILRRLVSTQLGLERRAAAALAALRDAPPLAPVPLPAPRPITTSLPRPAYLRAVRAALEHIAAGDCFQVNLTQRLTAGWSAPLSDLYRRLRDASPAPHAAALPDVGVASVSPETFLEVRGAEVAVRPIKGTRPRDPDPEVDAAHADDLATSTKDRAENVMIVDLERNDLGRVCVPGTVRVPQLSVVEAHPTVWHLVSEVVGRLRPEVGYGQLLAATFPCGSITGAPKVRAMEVIEELEPVRRGWYCGAIGFLSPGAASLSVAIRTATRHADGTVDHGAGGGIVADSDPEAEHRESLDKAAAFLAAVGAEDRDLRGR